MSLAGLFTFEVLRSRYSLEETFTIFFRLANASDDSTSVSLSLYEGKKGSSDQSGSDEMIVSHLVEAYQDEALRPPSDECEEDDEDEHAYGFSTSQYTNQVTRRIATWGIIGGRFFFILH